MGRADADGSAAVLRAEVRRILGEQTPELLGGWMGKPWDVCPRTKNGKDVEHGEYMGISDLNYLHSIIQQNSTRYGIIGFSSLSHV